MWRLLQFGCLVWCLAVIFGPVVALSHPRKQILDEDDVLEEVEVGKVFPKSIPIVNGHHENSVVKTKLDELGTVFKSSIIKLKQKNKKIDLVFLIDSSSSVGKVNFQNEVRFVKKLLADFTVSYNHTRVAIVTFSSQGKVIRHIDQISEAKKENDKCMLINYDIPKIRFVGGGTFTYGAFKEAKEIFQKARKHSKKVIFLITDGFSNGKDPVPLAMRLKSDNVTIYSVGIENGNFAELFNISSAPQEKHSFLLDSFPQFESLARKALHFDFRVGSYISTSNESLCNSLCDLGNATSCCDDQAECNCGTSSGHFTCICEPGYYGSGLKDSCQMCPNGTYWHSWNLCKPCPDINHITVTPLTSSLDDCVCKTGFKPVGNRKCEGIRCPVLVAPENGYFVKHPNGCVSVLNAACGARCKSGFQLSGSSIRLCQQNGTWSGTDPVCSLKTCPALPIPYYGLAICKNNDLNLFYDYSPRNETFMEHFDDEELRITEPMPIDTDCNFKCGMGYYLVGSGSRNCLPLSKWDGLQTACKQIVCSPLPRIPFGQYDPTDCDESKSSHGTNCTIQCLDGFELKGPTAKVCNGKRNGVWSNKNKNPKCVDVTAPNITCPANYSLVLEATESHVVIKELKQPTIVDNSNLNVTFWSKPALKENGTMLPRGDHVITYVTVDAFKNKARCNFTISVLDVTPPVLDNCIDPEVIKIRSNNTLVEWDEPIVYDNSNEPINVTQSLKPGNISTGVHVVNYTAVDMSNNVNFCILNVTVEEYRCHKLESPHHGHSVCALNATNMWCEISCDPGFGMLDEADDQQLESFQLICTHDDPKWKWDMEMPDCSELQLPDSINEILSIELETGFDYCGDSVNKTELMESIQKELCGDQLDCSVVSEMPSCEDEANESENSELSNAVYHVVKREIQPSKKPKRMRPKNKINVKINIYTRISKKLGLWNGNLTRSDNVKRIRHDLEHLHENPRLKSKISELKIDLTKLKIDVNMSCPKGNVLKKHVCVKCPRGTFHSVTTNKCQLCPLGTFSPLPGQQDCQSCPEHHATRRPESKTAEECVQQCAPGTIARLKTPKNPQQSARVVKSLMPYCKRCLPGEYQPNYDQTKCEPCPEGHISPRGSKHRSDCVPKQVNPCVSDEKVCGNHGECLIDSVGQFLYSCVCKDGYFGSHCEHTVNPCLSAPCENGGTCVHVRPLEVVCRCSDYYAGQFCEQLRNPCPPGFCHNNGTCLEVEGRLECECHSGFYGDRCELMKDHCLENPCVSGACINTPNGYLCQCPPGLIGRRCHLHPCDFVPCEKNRICENLPHSPATRFSFICRCPKGFTGIDCQTIDNPCDKQPCKNNGVCRPQTLERGPLIDENIYDAFACDCPVYLYGSYCEILVTPDFVLKFAGSQTTDYVKLPGPKRDLKSISLCAWIQTNDTKNYGTIISYATDSVDNMFTLTDYNGLTMYINGSHVISDIVANDGKWHFVCVAWENEKGFYEMYIDGQLTLTGYNLSTGSVIEGGGVLILGQEQDNVGSGFSAAETFVGKMGYLDIWDRFLTVKEIQDFYTTCEPYHGSLFVWSDFKDHINGNVQVVYSPFCKECPKNISVQNGRINFVGNNAIYSCNEGYRMNSLPIRHCLRTSQWRDPAPICRVITCPTVPNITQGRAFVTKYTFGGRASYSCSEGHTLQGSPLRSCLVDGTWSGAAPECISIIKCPSLASTEGVRIIYSTDKGPLSYESNHYPVGTLVEVECLHQSLQQGEYILSCQENGEWDFPVPHCGDSEEVTTEIRKFTFHPEYEYFSSSSAMMLVTPMSDKETQTIELNREEFWSEFRNYLYHGCLSPIYRSKFCDLISQAPIFDDLSVMNLKDIENKAVIEKTIVQILKSEITSKGSDLLTINNFHERIILSNANLINESFSRQILCFSMDFVIWNFEAYTTNRVTIAEIDKFQEPMEQIRYLLVKAMVPIFNNFNKIYKYKDFFEPKTTETGVVERKGCNNTEIPVLTNGSYETGENTEVTYKCDTDYRMVGSFQVTCNKENRNWDIISEGKCLRKCEQVNFPSNIKDIDTSAYLSGSSVKLGCIEGYQLHGNSTIQCLSTGKWSKLLCRCSKISCNKPKLVSGSVLHGKSYLFQDTITIQCSSGVFEVTCGSNGKWKPEISC